VAAIGWAVARAGVEITPGNDGVASRAITNNQQSAWSSTGNVTLNGTANLAPNQTAASGASVMTRDLVDARFPYDGEPIGWQRVEPWTAWGGGLGSTIVDTPAPFILRGVAYGGTATVYKWFKTASFTSSRTNLTVITTWHCPTNSAGMTYIISFGLRYELGHGGASFSQDITNTVVNNSSHLFSLTNTFQTPQGFLGEVLVQRGTTNAVQTLTNATFLTDFRYLLH
jgi:hypothetical protein